MILSTYGQGRLTERCKQLDPTGNLYIEMLEYIKQTVIPVGKHQVWFLLDGKLVYSPQDGVPKIQFELSRDGLLY